MSSSSKPFKIGFIGAGGIAMAQMRHLKKVEGAEVVAAADVNEKGLNKAKDEFGIQKLYTDYRKMLEEYFKKLGTGTGDRN